MHACPPLITTRLRTPQHENIIESYDPCNRQCAYPMAFYSSLSRPHWYRLLRVQVLRLSIENRQETCRLAFHEQKRNWRQFASANGNAAGAADGNAVPNVEPSGTEQSSKEPNDLWTLESQRKAALDRMIRVDHAGEIGARRIYDGQLRVLGGTPAAPIIHHMAEQERRHAEVFDELVKRYRVRPTALLPLWNLAGFLLGAGTALLGRESAMACTVAVEEVVAQHYDDQLRELIALEKQHASVDGDVGPAGAAKSPEAQLRHYIRQFRDEELEHKDTGLEHGAELAPAYRLLSFAVRTACRAAIFVSERI